MYARFERADTSDADAVIVVTGSLDLMSRDQLSDAVHQAISSSSPRSLTIDLSAVDFIDSTGLGTLVGVRSDAQDRDIELTLRAPSARVNRILDVTGLSDVFTITAA